MVDIDKKIEKLYYDLKVPFEILQFEDENSRNYFEIKKHLNNAVNLIDMRNPYSGDFYNSLEKAEEYLQTEFYGKYCKDIRTLMWLGSGRLRRPERKLCARFQRFWR